MNQFLVDLFKDQDYNKNNFFLMAGPCVVESEELVLQIAERVSQICKQHGIPLIFKASYKKANRTSANSFTGLGDETGLKIIQKAGKEYDWLKHRTILTAAGK